MLLYRNILFTSGLNPRQYTKAEEIGADFGVVNLEDPVPPEHKAASRAAALSFFEREHALPYGLVINSLRDAYGFQDVVALADSAARPDLVFLPKIESPEELRILEDVLAPRLPNLRLAVIIESVRGLQAVDEIARATPRMAALAFGAADCAAELRVEVGWESLLYARSRIVAAAANAGIACFDSPYFRLQDLEGLERECRGARQLGFTGKLSIHPRHIPVINSVFGPSPQAVAYARAVIAACEQNEGGIAVVDGNMVGPPFVTIARRILAVAGA